MPEYLLSQCVNSIRLIYKEMQKEELNEKESIM